jgi:hypothetical protein
MTDVAAGAAGKAWEAESHGVDWHLELDRMPLLPGRLVTGRLRLIAKRDVTARGVVVSLIAEEHWRHRVTQRDANGTTTTRVVTERRDHVREPVMVHGALHLAPGETWTAGFELPVPPMGPATLDAEDAGLAWSIEGKLDIDDSLDSALDAPVVVAQPLALLRAGAVHVGEFALYESAEVASDGITGSIAFESMPLVAGDAIRGHVRLQLPTEVKLQEIRAELAIQVEATVPDGEREMIPAWTATIAPAGIYAGALTLPISGSLGPRPLPTIELPHGRAAATFHVILARAWAADTHLVRDVTIATTSEL